VEPEEVRGTFVAFSGIKWQLPDVTVKTTNSRK